MSRKTYCRSIAHTLLVTLFTLHAPASAQEDGGLFGDWGGSKNTLQENGIAVEGVVIADVAGVVSGGRERGAVHTVLYSLGIETDTAEAGLWEDGTFVVNLVGITGGPIYQKVGDFQFTSNIDALGQDTFNLYEAWYEHSFFDGALTWLNGMHDYNSEFYALDYGAVLLNASFGFGIELSQTGNSTYPVTGLASRVRYQPTDNSYAMFAVYDGIPGSPRNPKGTHVHLRKDDGLFYAAEVGITSTEEETPTDYYKIALGGWYRTTNYTDYRDIERSSNGGGYIIGERKLFAEEDTSQGLGAFFQIGATQGDRNVMGQYLGLGLHYTGLIPCRDGDVFAIGMAHARRGTSYKEVDSNLTKTETTFEWSYRADIGHGIAIQPDIQYVINPGASEELDNALVLTARIEVML